MADNGRRHHHGEKGDCKKTLTEMSQYVDNDLKGSGKKNLETHLASCKACMAVLNTLKKTIELFRASTPRMPKNMAKEVRQGIKRQIVTGAKKGK